MYRLLINILVILLATTALAQEEVVVLKDFGPLNTKSGIFSLSPNAFVKAHNVDFGKIGTIRSRLGYDSVSNIPGQDSCVNNGLFPAYYDDGTQQLFAVADSTGVGYGAIYTTPLGSINFQDSAVRQVTHWPITRSAQFTQYQNDIYITNGSGGGAVYNHNKQELHRYPVLAPGEPLIVPLKASGNVNGEFRYTINVATTLDPNWTTGDSNVVGIYDGFISSPISIDDGQVLITGFAGLARDTLFLSDRRRILIGPVSILDNTLYELTINSDVIGYTSDGTATREEIITNLISLINADSPGMADTVTARPKSNTFPADAKVEIHGNDNTIDYTFSVSSTLNIDSSYFVIRVFRSQPNLGVLDLADTAQLIAGFQVFDTLILDTLTVIDNTVVENLLFPVFTDTLKGRDSNGIYATRWGAPQYLSGAEITGADTASRGIYAGWIDDDTTSIIGMAYAITFIDTVLGVESDTGRSLAIFKDAGNTDQYMTYTLSLPKVPANALAIKKNIYRAPIFRIGALTAPAIEYDITITDEGYMILGDSSIVSEGGGGPGTETIVYFGGPYYSINPDNFTGNVDDQQVDPDKMVVGQYRWVTQVSALTETYADSTRYDSLTRDRIINPAYSQVSTPFFPNNVFSFQNRLFFTYKSRLYYSNLDLQLLNLNKHDFGAFDFIPVTENDGDEITFAYPEKDYIRVFKNRSAHVVFEKDLDGFFTYNIDGTFFTSVEVTDHRGLVAPRSFIHTPFGNAYMSQEGIALETKGVQLERTFNMGLLSDVLDNFDNLSLRSLSRTIGAYYPREQKAMFGVGDTTYVYDFYAGKWATWDRLFNASALYGVESSVDFLPGDTLYFTKGGSNNLYRYGTSKSDNGDSISVSWKFAPLFPDAFRRTITRIGVWAGATNATDSTFIIRSYNSRDSLLDSTVYRNLDTKRYRLKSFPNKTGLFHSLEMGTTVGNGLGNIEFDRFDIFTTRHGLIESE